MYPGQYTRQYYGVMTGTRGIHDTNLFWRRKVIFSQSGASNINNQGIRKVHLFILGETGNQHRLLAVAF